MVKEEQDEDFTFPIRSFNWAQTFLYHVHAFHDSSDSVAAFLILMNENTHFLLDGIWIWILFIILPWIALLVFG